MDRLAFRFENCLEVVHAMLYGVLHIQTLNCKDEVQQSACTIFRPSRHMVILQSGFWLLVL